MPWVEGSGFPVCLSAARVLIRWVRALRLARLPAELRVKAARIGSQCGGEKGSHWRQWSWKQEGPLEGPFLLFSFSLRVMAVPA